MYRKITYLCISSISVSDMCLGARDNRANVHTGKTCYATQPVRFSSRSHKTQTQYHNLSKHALKEDPMKHHCLIVLLASDMGYIAMVGHGQSQLIFHSFQTSYIQLQQYYPRLCLLHILHFLKIHD